MLIAIEGEQERSEDIHLAEHIFKENVYDGYPGHYPYPANGKRDKASEREEQNGRGIRRRAENKKISHLSVGDKSRRRAA